MTTTIQTEMRCISEAQDATWGAAVASTRLTASGSHPTSRALASAGVEAGMSPPLLGDR